MNIMDFNLRRIMKIAKPSEAPKKISFFICVFACAAASLFAENSMPVELCSAASKSGMSFFWDPLTSSGVLEKNGHRVSFKSGDSFVLHDYKNAVMEKAPWLENGTVYTEASFLASSEKLFRTESSENAYRIGAILIDPGHGGKDPGASQVHVINGKSTTVVEKNINLNVGLKLYDYLKKTYPDKRILMTRSSDVFLSLGQRTEIANSVRLKPNEAILYVSVHVNANLDKTASGYEVWYLSPGYRRQVLDAKASSGEEKSVIPILNSMMEEEFTTESILIAKFIMDGISAQVGNQSAPRGIKAEEWYVCRNSNMPSVLVELGFLTNKKEAALLSDNAYLQKLSFGIYNGLQAFVTHFEQSRGFTGK